MTSTYIAYRGFDRTYVDRLDAMTRAGPVQREIEYFVKNIGKIETGDQLINDPKLYRFAMTAFDLESQVFAKGLVRKLLREGVTEPTALANRLTDAKFRTFAKAFAFAEVGSFNVQNPEFVRQVVARYTAVKLETQAGDENIAVRLAAYFDRQSGRIGNWYAVLADKALREVVFTTLGIPDEFNVMNPDRLVEVLKDRFDIADFKDPEKRDKFIERFTVMYDVKNGAPAAELSRAALFAPLSQAGGGQIITIDPATLGAIRRA
jgi:hypothetical protein